MKHNHTTMLATVTVLAAGLGMVNSSQAQGITGGQYLNINPAAASFTGDWNAGDSTSTATGLEIVAPGGSGSFSTMYYSIPTPAANNPSDTQVVFDFTINSATFAPGLDVNVLFALDDSVGGVDYYGTGYTIGAPGAYSVTFPLQSPNLADVAGGAVINGMNLQMDPANISGNYDITFNSITLETSAVPEPSTFAYSSLGAAAIWLLRRRK